MSQLEGASYRVRFTAPYLAEAGLTPETLAGALGRQVHELLARPHVIVRRRGEGQSREFDARPSIAALEVVSEGLDTVLDCHLRFTPRAVVRPEELLVEMFPPADSRTADVERTTLWAESDGRRLDPLELLSVRDPGVEREHGIPA
jgi:hypothetical protein